MKTIMKTEFEKTGMIKITLCCICWLLLASCERTYCPAFPEHLVDYFPYNIGDSLLFINQYNDSVSFILFTIAKTEAHSFGNRCDCACDNLYGFAASNNWTHIRGKITIDAKPEFFFELGNGYWDRTTLSDSFMYLYEETGKDPFDPKNNALFGETVILHDSETQIARVVIVKGKGITEFYDQKYNFQWISINKQ